MFKRRLQIILLFFVLLVLFGAGGLANAQTSEVGQHANRLSNIERNLKQKQAEQVKLLREERTVKRDLEFLNDAIRKTEKRLKDLSDDIRNAEQNQSKASRNYKDASKNAQLWNQTILDDIWLFNKMSILGKYERNPVEYKIREAAIKSKKNKFDSEQNRADLSSSDISKWQKAKSDLMSLKDKESKLANERKSLIEEKNKLLKTTSNQRVKAEREIKELQQSAAQLQRVMQSLVQESKRKEQQRIKAEQQKVKAEQKKQTAINVPQPETTLRPRAEISKARSQADSKKRRVISPPVSGQVIQHFGKNQHDELNTFVISNGIKLKADNGAVVRSVEPGTVVYLGQFRSYGNVVIIDHNGFFAVYGQLSKIFVRDNQSVKRGDTVGQLGSGNNSVLYFEIRRDNVPDNPMLWFKR
ncbi:MAG: peptidoglycan DD-metalloendopeptidase family protein [Elusimicrobiota bacterium]|jgi:septal ring factor EnvC (AmiA/AmiB activator)|nr:peptidoglycan DD-metalloendopeptidase family protein [Elusimicrobiota bacterium]